MIALRLQSLSEGFLLCYPYPDKEHLLLRLSPRIFHNYFRYQALAVEHEEISVYDIVLFVFYDLSKVIQS